MIDESNTLVYCRRCRKPSTKIEWQLTGDWCPGCNPPYRGGAALDPTLRPFLGSDPIYGKGLCLGLWTWSTK